MTDGPTNKPRIKIVMRRGRPVFLAVDSPEGLNITPRQGMLLIALLLAVVLLILVLAMLLVSSGNAVSFADREPYGNLRPVMVIDGPGKGPNPKFGMPMSAAWGPNGWMYIADSTNNRICVFNAKGRFLFEFGSLGITKPTAGAKATWKPGSLNYPTGIAVGSENGDVYVADFYNNTIEVFNAKGKFLRRFPDPNTVVGKGGSGINGTGLAVTDVAVHEGKVYATDAFQVFVFDRFGKLLDQFGKPGAGTGDLDRPNGIAVSQEGFIYVSDSNHSRIVKYDPTGHPLMTVGQKIQGLSTPTSNPFVLPRGLTFLQDGSLLIADPLNISLVHMSKDGKVIETYGERGQLPAQLNFPNDVDSRGDLVLVADRGNRRVQVVRLVRR